MNNHYYEKLFVNRLESWIFLVCKFFKFITRILSILSKNYYVTIDKSYF